ncbi:glutamate-cysteine ligase modifier subunit [Xylaria cf. heliscus]|nr:glutamate-cysteine ligase modifier subunit [Xylaria cf. heliscus]
MTRIVLSTGNIVTAGPSIIRKPGITRSNLELTSSLRSNFIAAQQDYAGSPVSNNGNGSHAHANGHLINGHSRPAVDAWTDTEDSVLYVPRVDWAAAGLQEDRIQYEITLKLFFLPSAPAAKRTQYIDEALRLVMKELQIDYIDLLIVSFPGISFEGDCEWEADKINATMGNDEEEVATWTVLERLYEEGRVHRLGIAEFGTEKLQRFIDRVKVRPAVDQINTKDCCSVPPPLTKLAKSEGIELLTHGDCTDILPSGTLRELLGHGPQGAGVLADVENAQSGLKGDLVPEWVAKYTAFVKYRGVIENKGYFAGAELVQA